MASIYDLLKIMIEKGASDLHVTTASPPRLRVDGKLIPLDHPQLTPVETKALCYSILTDAQKHKFEENSELDLSFGVKGTQPVQGQYLHAERSCCSGIQDHPVRDKNIPGSRTSGGSQ